MYLLDTNVLIDYSKGREPVYSQVLVWTDAEEMLAACSVTVAEFFAGLNALEMPGAREFIETLAYWPITRGAAIRAGQDRYLYARRGITLTTTDALIAAVARARSATLVTANVKDFPMDDLALFPLIGTRPR